MKCVQSLFFAYLYFLEFLVSVYYSFLGLFIACVLSSGYLTLISKLILNFHDWVASQEISLPFWNPKFEYTLACSQSPAIEPYSDQSNSCSQPFKSCFFKINFNIVLQSGFSLEVCQPKCYIRFVFPPVRVTPMYRNYLSMMNDVIVCCIHHSFHILFTCRVITVILQHVV